MSNEMHHQQQQQQQQHRQSHEPNELNNFGRAHAEHRQLLLHIKTTIDSVFLNSKYSSSSQSLLIPVEGLLRLHTCIEQILTNGIRIYRPDNTPDLWQFIEGLNWINPHMTISITSESTLSTCSIPYARIRNDRALKWIYENLHSHKLSPKLKYLVSDREHLNNSYEITSFLQTHNYVEALFIALQSIENNQPNLLSQIDPNLYKTNSDCFQHKRSTSHPDFSYVTKLSGSSSVDGSVKTMGAKQSIPAMYDSDVESRRSSRGADLANRMDRRGKLLTTVGGAAAANVGICGTSSEFRTRSTSANGRPTKKSKQQQQQQRRRRQLKQNVFISLQLRPWRSLPNIQEAASLTDFCKHHRLRSKTISQPVGGKPYKIRLTAEALALNNRRHDIATTTVTESISSWQTSPPGTSSQMNDLRPIALIKCDDIQIHVDQKFMKKLKPKDKQVDDEEAKKEGGAEVEELIGERESGTSESNDTSEKNSPSGLFGFFQRNRDVFSLFHTGDGGENISGLFAAGRPSDYFSPKDGEKIKHSFQPHLLGDMESGRGSPIPVSSNQRPVAGQSLTAFLQAGQFSRVTSELERENAHFSVSEAMISAIEQIKWRNVEKDRIRRRLEIEQLRTGTKKKSQRSSTRYWERKAKNQSVESNCSMSDISPTYYLPETYSDSNDDSPNDEDNDDDDDNGDDGDDDDDESDSNSLQDIFVSSHNIKDHTAYAEWGHSYSDTLSAESVALSLISKFSDKQLPRASDLMWLVSEQEVPQKMLPLPGSWVVNPDEILKIPFTRGTRNWAPPRPQIIFTRHQAIEKKKQLQNQNHRCAGCGMKVAVAYSNRFRYCEYLGKFFCTGCHRNHMSIIPARVLDKWNFTSFPVSVFSYRLLNQIWSFPLFRVTDLNKDLYQKVRSLSAAKVKREQLKFTRDFITSCRFAENFTKLFENVQKYLTDEPDMWSMTDFADVKNGQFLKTINELIGKCETHVFACELCTARGFICEICKRDQIIFPWQAKIKRCNQCGVCVHERCWKVPCGKCMRIQTRK